jgi:5-methylcytosine-specific restriction endonuclease McrA
VKVNKRKKEELRKKLYQKYESNCYYCGIEEGAFIRIWGGFYGKNKRGIRLELDRKDNKRGYNLENCILACAICNNAKSDKFTYQEFLRIGKTIREIWISRRKNLKKREMGEMGSHFYH